MHTPDLELPDFTRRYVNLADARLGAGGMGQVYLARSDRGRTVAVKLVREELARQEEFRARFRQEVRAARQVGGDWTAPASVLIERDHATITPPPGVVVTAVRYAWANDPQHNLIANSAGLLATPFLLTLDPP